MARESAEALLSWRQAAAVAFAVGAVVASSPGIAVAAPVDEPGSSASDETGSDAPSKPDEPSDPDRDGSEAPDESGDDTATDDEDVTTTDADDPADVEVPDDLDDEEESPPAQQERESSSDVDDSTSRSSRDTSDAVADESDEDAGSEPADSGDREPETVEVPDAEPIADQAPTQPPAITEMSISTQSNVSVADESVVPEARPVNAATIVADVLTWMGMGSLAADLPIPALPVPRLLEMMWVAVRQTQYAWNNQRPTAQPTLLSQDDGVIVGDLNATDFDDSQLTYTVSTPARFGTVVVNADGTFTYTPRTGIAVTTDSFTVTIDDAPGNQPHVHGLAGLLGLSAPTTAHITVDVAGSGTPISSTDVTRPGAVTVQMSTDGRISLIDGTFTQARVSNSADAAAVLNAFASVLGAENGFATTDLITVHRVGASGTVEEFYRLRQNIDGIEVIGSDVVLVTDGNGTVTGLFNYHDSRLADVDTTPDISDGSAAAALAAAHLATSTGLQPGSGPRVLESATAKAELVIVSLGDDAAPSLAWRVELRAGSTDAPAVGATYYIRANGADAGEVIVGTSNIQGATTVARDLLGVDRPINVEAAKWWFFFDSQALIDSTRNITTYATGFSFFGLGSPYFPGNIVTRSLFFGWNGSGISAHANMAVVYDYYLAVLGRDSFDGEGGTVVSSVGYNPREDFVQYFGGYANAFWDPGAQQFAFGNAGSFEAGLDIVAHEYTHGVVSHILANGGSVLDYGESGALNEAYADILGNLIEGKTGAGRWLVGEDASGGAIRSMANPTAVGSGYRAHYSLRYTGTADDGGEHWNSTIFSHAGYRMMTDPDTAGVSSDTWAKVFYNSLYRLTPGAKFVDGRAAILDTAAEYGFTPAEMQAIEDAFDSVGIVGGATLRGADAHALLAV